ncbi:MAG: RAMP superfamily CRISPR-associated protein [Egibacteraceae bacterium]
MGSKRREATVRIDPETGLPGVELGAGQPRALDLLPSKVLRKLPDHHRRRLVDGARVRLDIVDHAGFVEIRRVEIIRDAPKSAAKRGLPREARVEPGAAAVPDRDRAARMLAAEREGLAWVNPYTFLPFVARPPADRFARPRSRTAPWPDGGELVSGRFTVTLEIASPLAIYGGHQAVAPTHEVIRKEGAWQSKPLPPEEQERRRADPKQAHRQVALLRDERGLPTIPGATLKGAMRSWLEAITSSPRPSSELPVTWRAVSLAPRLPGRLRLTLGGRPVGDLRKRSKAELERVSAEIIPMQLPAPGEEAEERDKALASEWNLPERLQDGATVRSGSEVGYLKVSAGIGRDPSLSVQVFLDDPNAVPVRLSVETLQNWWAAHKHSGDPARGGSMRWAGRQWTLDHRLDARVLGDRALVWYTLDQDRQVAYLGRIKSGRWAHRSPMAGRVPTAHRGSADDTLAPADRIYGTVGKGGPEDAWAGRVRVSSARWAVADEPATETITLVPLSSPKVSSAGLYLTDPKAKPVAWDQPGGGGQLAGTKVYWHTPPIGLDGGVATRVHRLGTADEPIKTAQNATVEAVVNGALRFEDLDARELGALLLACSLRVTGDQPARAGWKLGMGKPVGMGSVTNTVSDLRIFDLQRRYEDPVRPDAGLEPAVVGKYERIALDYFLLERRDRDVLAGIADLDAMRDDSVAYPEPGALRRKPGREGTQWVPQPSAEQVLFERQPLALTDRASSRRKRDGWPGRDPRPL